MKRFICVLLCIVLATSVTACSACGGGPPLSSVDDSDTGVTTTKAEVRGNENTESEAVNTVNTTENQTVETAKTKKTRKPTTSRTAAEQQTGSTANLGSGYVDAAPRELEQAGLMRYLGRTLSAVDGSCFMLYGNTGFVITGTLEGYVNMTFTVEKNACAINVVIDGDVANKKTVWKEAGTYTVVIAEDLSKGTHTIEVTKGTAHHAGTLNVSSLRYNGTLKSPVAADLQLEFIGDSVTVGEGMYGKASGGVELAMSYNTFDGYAAQVARNLGADVSTIAACGSKVPGMRNAFLDSSWNFADNPKDVVVINMGTNDLGWSSISLSSVEATLRPDCTALIEAVRTKYGKDTYIIWAYGMMFDKDKNFFEDVVETYATEHSDSRVLFCDLSAAKDNSGNASHPSTKGNDKAATILTQFIKEHCQ